MNPIPPVSASPKDALATACGTTRQMSRRDFLNTTAMAGMALAGRAPTSQGADNDVPSPQPGNVLPRWRGFNLVNFFQALSKDETGQGLVQEEDLRWMRDWGFDYVRLPMDYWFWIDSDWKQTRTLTPEDWFKIKESSLEKVDRTVDLCRQYKLHLTLNFHRAPGYCINNPEREPLVLWQNKEAQDAFVHHWDLFARRYRDASSADLSFNLVNEAPSPRDNYMTRDDYARIMKRACDQIQKHRADRIVIVDGLSVGNEVVTELIPTGMAQSVHAYWPGGISHYRASWVDRNASFPTPTWPLKNQDGSVQANRKQLEERFTSWGQLVRQGVGVHCGECGCYNKTPYEVFISWFEDNMQVLKSHGIGYALWNFRGSFGILDSGRQDIQYEAWHGHKLDRRLLDLLLKY